MASKAAEPDLEVLFELHRQVQAASEWHLPPDDDDEPVTSIGEVDLLIDPTEDNDATGKDD